MTKNMPPPIPLLLTENAPFSPEQRAWLSGFLAGCLGLEINGAPGGKETARTLKALYQELDQVPGLPKAAIPSPAAATAVPAEKPGHSRESPVQAVLLSRMRLNKPGSEKETWHIEFDLGPSGL